MGGAGDPTFRHSPTHSRQHSAKSASCRCGKQAPDSGAKVTGPWSVLARTAQAQNSHGRQLGRPTGLARPKRQGRRGDRQSGLGNTSSNAEVRGTAEALSGRGPAPRAPARLQQDRGTRKCRCRAGAGRTYSGGGGLVLAHTTDLRRPFLCQPCPALRLLSASEIPRERRIIVGLSPLNLPRKPERRMERVRSARTVLCCGVHARKPHRRATGQGPGARRGEPPAADMSSLWRSAPGRQHPPCGGDAHRKCPPTSPRPGPGFTLFPVRPFPPSPRSPTRPSTSLCDPRSSFVLWSLTHSPTREAPLEKRPLLNPVPLPRST